MRLRGPRLGSTIGAVGGLLFVVLNCGELPASVAMRVVALVLFVMVIVRVRRAAGAPAPEPGDRDLRLYGIVTAAEVVAIPAGAFVLRAVDHSELTLPWVVLVLGVHFLPFSRAFRAPLFLGLALIEVVVAVVGGVATLAGAGDAPDWTGVVAGYVLLAFALTGVLRWQASTRAAAASAAMPQPGHSSEGVTA